MVLLEIVTRLFSILWWLLEFLFPVKLIVVDDGERGVIYICGRAKRELTSRNGIFRSGLHVATIFMRMEKGAVLGHVVQVDGVNVFTKEGVPMTVYAAVTYDIVDYIKSIIQVDLDNRVSEVVTADLLAKFSRMTLEQAVGPMRAIETSLRNTMSSSLEPLGVEPAAHPRITGREFDEPCIARAYLIPAMEDLLGGKFARHERAAIIAGATLVTEVESALEEEPDEEEPEEESDLDQ